MRCFGDAFEKTLTSMFLTMFLKTQTIVATMHLTMLIAHPYPPPPFGKTPKKTVVFMLPLNLSNIKTLSVLLRKEYILVCLSVPTTFSPFTFHRLHLKSVLFTHHTRRNYTVEKRRGSFENISLDSSSYEKAAGWEHGQTPYL